MKSWYKKGQLVKWIAKDQPSKREWRTGFFQSQRTEHGMEVIQVKKEHGDEIVQLPIHAVKPFERIEDTEIVLQFGMDNIDALLVLVQKGLKAIMPQYEKDVQKDTHNLLLLNGMITIEPVAVEEESLDGFREYPGWSVTLWRNIPATRDCPPELDDIFIGNAKNSLKAASLAIDTLYKIISECFWDGLLMEALYQEEEHPVAVEEGCDKPIPFPPKE